MTGTVTIGVTDLASVKRRTAAAFRGETQGSFLTFASVELLWRTMTPRRWTVLQALTGKGAMSLRAVARLTGRDIKTTHGDVHALLNSGILEKTENGQVIFPYDTVHVDFTITKAA